MFTDDEILMITLAIVYTAVDVPKDLKYKLNKYIRLTPEIVYCKNCANHGGCSVEETFDAIELSEEKRFCGIGKTT